MNMPEAVLFCLIAGNGLASGSVITRADRASELPPFFLAELRLNMVS